MPTLLTTSKVRLQKIIMDNFDYSVRELTPDTQNSETVKHYSPIAIIIFIDSKIQREAVSFGRSCNNIAPVIFISDNFITSIFPDIVEITGAHYLVDPVSFDNLQAAIKLSALTFAKTQKSIEKNHISSEILEKSKELIAIIDAKGNFTYNNHAHFFLTGYSPDELMHKNAFDFVHPEDLPQVLKTYNQIHQKDDSSIVEFRFKKKDNSWLWVEANGTVILENDTIIGMIGFSRDITKRKIIEQELVKRENFYREIVEKLPVFICRFKPENAFITYVNNEYCRYFNIQQDDIIGKSFFDLVPEDEHVYIKEKFESLHKDNPYITYEHSVLVNDEIKYQRWTDQALFDKDHNVVEYQSIGIDITEKKIAEQELKFSEEKYRQLFENESSAVLVFDLETDTFEDVNKAALALFGYTKNQFMNLSFPDILSKIKSTFDIKKALLASGRTISWYKYFKKKDGTIFSGEISAGLFTTRKGKKTICTIHDISERIIIEKEIVRASQKERRRIGQDLHDGLGQYLTGISLVVAALKKKIMDNKTITIKEIEAIDNLVSETKDDISNILEGLMPVIYNTGNIFIALEKLAEQTTKISKITCEVKNETSLTLSDEMVSTNLFYIAQEAVNNSIKHSNADRIDIELSYKNSIFMMKIQDNGTIFQKQNNAGMGRKIMKHRAAALGADYYIDFTKNGFVVMLQLFIKEPYPG